MKAVPVDDGLLLEAIHVPEVLKKSKLIVVAGQNTEVAKAKVVAVGPGRPAALGDNVGNWRHPMQCRVGDIVLLDVEGFQNVIIDGKSYLYTRENLILVILERTQSGVTVKEVQA